MKGLFTAFSLFALLTISASAQPESLLTEPVDHGGYGGASAQLTELNGELGLLVGASGGWIIDHTFAIGGAGYGIATDIPAVDVTSSKPSFLKFGYGGVTLAYIYRSDDLVHFSAGALFGAGGMQYTNASPSSGWGPQDTTKEADGFYVVEPGINAELNVASYFRINLGGSYRFVTGAELQDIGNDDLSGPAATLSLKFGGF